jgi:glycerol-3-phosphate dehydrogenase
MASEFLVRQAKTRLVALGPEQARQEALTLAHVRASLGVDHVAAGANAASPALRGCARNLEDAPSGKS